MQDYFCIENSPILDLPPRNGAILGFNLDHPDIMTFMKEYSILAHKKNVLLLKEVQEKIIDKINPYLQYYIINIQIIIY